MKTLLLSDREALALDKALELYIRLGLGQIRAVGDVVKDLAKKRNVDTDDVKEVNWCLLDAENKLKSNDNGEWKLEDVETDSLTVAAFGIQAKLGDNHSAWEWACKRLHENNDLD
jgi:hypothetical protein